MDYIRVKNAIISVSDKTGLLDFARALHSLGIRIYSTGGTAEALESGGIPVVKISDYTGFPEILDGRVKSLHPRIHGGILACRDNPAHMAELDENGIVPFDMVVINLYPFEQVIQKPGTGIDEAIENIDIGGPSMLRSSAKNYRFVCVLPDPAYYPEVLRELKEKGGVSIATRKRLAMAVFEKTAYYDSLIAGYFHSAVVERKNGDYPDMVSIFFRKRQELRYGENPHQSAAFYTNPMIKVSGVSTAKQLHGKELSFNNILDIESAFEMVKEFREPACAVIKHTNPCGVGVSDNAAKAFTDAWECDPASAFGGIIGFNTAVDEKTSEAVSRSGFVECIIAPGYGERALAVLEKKQNLRLLDAGSISRDEIYDFDMKRVIGGILLQGRDLEDFKREDLKVVTKKGITEDDYRSLLFAWKVAKHVKSNAVVLAHGMKTVGIGAGQMSRVDAAFMAVTKAGERAKGSVLASDAFFPKEDAVQLAARHGIRAIIQPGGSLGDRDAIRVCDEAGIAMVFTGFRHFRH